MTEWLAVYGTLRRASGMQQRLGVAAMLRFESPCVIKGRLVDLGDYPGLLEGEGRVSGELFAVLDSAAWRLLDAYEGEEFVRRSMHLEEPRLEAIVYLYQPA